MRTLTPHEMHRALQILSLDREWRKEIRKTYGFAARVAANAGRKEMRGSGDRQLVAAARGVKAGSSNRAGYVRVVGRVPTSSGKDMSVLAPVWGTKRPTGWYAGWTRDRRGQKVFSGRKQRGYAAAARRNPNNPPWVGNSWTVGERGQGPRGINDGIHAEMDAIVSTHTDAVMKLVDRATNR